MASLYLPMGDLGYTLQCIGIVHVKVYVQLHALLYCRILMAVRNLLSLIPINAKVLEGLEIFVHPGLGPGASGDLRPSTNSPQAILEDFFSTKSISPNELLYNLEVKKNLSVVN